jgi:hypothetical protein
VDFVLDLLQGAGIAAAFGIRPLLPLILVGALAAANLGLDFDGTDFVFLEQWPFLAGAVVVLAGVEYAGRRTNVGYLLLGISIVLGALYAAGSLADHDYNIAPGVVVGVACAALGYFAALSLFTRVRRRLDPEAASVLPLYGEGAAGASAGVSVLFPPLALLVIGGLAWLLSGGRRRQGEKYAGLRILR